MNMRDEHAGDETEFMNSTQLRNHIKNLRANAEFNFASGFLIGAFLAVVMVVGVEQWFDACRGSPESMACIGGAP